MPKKKKRTEVRLVGLGMDNKDGHIRVTTGDNFDIFLGSETTHERMQEICIKFNEKLSRKGKKLEQLSHDEIRNLISETD